MFYQTFCVLNGGCKSSVISLFQDSRSPSCMYEVIADSNSAGSPLIGRLRSWLIFRSFFKWAHIFIVWLNFDLLTCRKGVEIYSEYLKKSNLHYTRCITPKLVTHVRVLAPGQHSSKETSQRAVGNTVSHLIGPAIESKTFRTDSDVLKHYASRPISSRLLFEYFGSVTRFIALRFNLLEFNLLK